MAQTMNQNIPQNTQNISIQNQQVLPDGNTGNGFMKNSGGGSNGKTTESSHLSSDYASENQVVEKVSCSSTSSSSGLAANIQVQKKEVVEI